MTAASYQSFTRIEPSSPPNKGFAPIASIQNTMNDPYAAPARVPLDGTALPTQTHGRARSVSIPGAQAPRVLQPFDREEIKILLLENVSQGAVAMLRVRAIRSTSTPAAGPRTSCSKKLATTTPSASAPRRA